MTIDELLDDLISESKELVKNEQNRHEYFVESMEVMKELVTPADTITVSKAMGREHKDEYEVYICTVADDDELVTACALTLNLSASHARIDYAEDISHEYHYDLASPKSIKKIHKKIKSLCRKVKK